MKLQIDSLVRGKVGSLNTVREMRVYRISAYNWVAGIESDSGRQMIMHAPEVIGPPRPVRARTDIPERLTR